LSVSADTHWKEAFSTTTSRGQPGVLSGGVADVFTYSGRSGSSRYFSMRAIAIFDWMYLGAKCRRQA
jgi:hypothetical protein